MPNYIELAKKKFNQSKEMDITLPFVDFIAEAYVKLRPQSYGAKIEKKISEDFGFTKVPAKDDLGDLKKFDEYYEVKTSFLSNGHTWSITHIRQWCEFQYYLLCLIDCEEGFEPNFFVLEKDTMNKIEGMTANNGTKNSNIVNNHIELRVNIKKGSKNHEILLDNNLLESTNGDSLNKFLESKLIKK